MYFDDLKKKAHSLPLSPGVYLMKDKGGNVIYVGKAKKLKNRVSQYFLDTVSHTAKTKLMVSKIHTFDVIVAATEFEALVLECSLIKQYKPKYNILLKDDKGYPYIRLDRKRSYPTITLANKPTNDGAEYYGPFGSRGVTNSILEALRSIFLLPSCSKVFPRDIGKDRPCLNHHMGQCAGWCQPRKTAEEYNQVIEQVRLLLQGKYKTVALQIKQDMLNAADSLNFELAASLRDRLAAVEALGKKQMVATVTGADTDVIGFAQTEVKACFAVLHYHNGDLMDKDVEILPATDDPEAAISSLLYQYYLNRAYVPKLVLLPFEVEDRELVQRLLEEKTGRKTHLKVPQRGDNVRLVELSMKNAQEEAQLASDQSERVNATLSMLGDMLAIKLPVRIESFDISNLSGTDIVAGMVVFENGRPKRSDYKRFKINDLQDQDDYASMAQAVTRRFLHLKNGDTGFETAPDLLLIDGGVTHAAVALDVLARLSLFIPVFGMVKDDRHRTRALVTPEGQEIRIDNKQNIFSFIGTIQEETHRFAIGYNKKLRSKRLRYSELDKISGIGAKRKELLLKTFGSIRSIRNASIMELERILPRDAANAVFQHFHRSEVD